MTVAFSLQNTPTGVKPGKCSTCGANDWSPTDRLALWRKSHSYRCRNCGQQLTIGNAREGWLGPFNKRIGPISQLLEPHLSFCGRCKTVWEFVESHSTSYKDGRGCFPLCELCWQELTIDERLTYYRELYDSWERLGYVEPGTWEQMRTAVLSGK